MNRNDTIRIMVRPKIALLGYALIGMLHQKPASGYDLRKIFKETPMAGYSDSPGAIYPALRRLEEMGLIKGIIEAGSGLRRRKVLRLTSGGVAALKKWLTKPIERADVVRGINELMLRFAFLDGAMGSASIADEREEERQYEIHLHLERKAPERCLDGFDVRKALDEQ